MRRIRRPLRFDAWFLWMTPRDAALSRRLTAMRRASSEPSAPVSVAVTADLTRVLISDFTALLRSRSFSFWRLRLIWLLILATGVLAGRPSGEPGQVTSRSR